MLTLTTKKYEIEEPIKITNENGEVLLDFIIKLTPEENLQVRDLLFDERDVKDGRILNKLEKENKIEELEELEAKVMERADKRQELLENIVFKNEKENIKNKIGEADYLELLDMIIDFFVKTFAEKRSAQINTMNSHLRKITNS